MQRDGLKLDGFAELDKQLAALGKKMATEIGRDAVVASSELLRDAWKAGAPYDPQQRGAAAKYGHLRDNITIGPVRAQNTNAVVYKVFTGNAYFGYFLEWGTAKMPPHPWARPIIERVKGEMVEVFVKRLNEGIEAAI